MSDRSGWNSSGPQREMWLRPAMHIDHVKSSSLVPRRFAGWCSVCLAAREMCLSWATSTIAPTGVIAPDWHGAVTCTSCGSPSNVRAAVQLLLERGRETGSVSVEGMTADVLSRVSGRIEHLRDLATTDTASECALSIDVLEGVSDWRAHLSHLRSAVRTGGSLVMTTHFDSSLESTVELATARAGAPRRRLGWDLLDAMRAAGFDEVTAHMYWAPWQGHLGVTSFLLEASA